MGIKYLRSPGGASLTVDFSSAPFHESPAALAETIAKRHASGERHMIASDSPAVPEASHFHLRREDSFLSAGLLLGGGIPFQEAMLLQMAGTVALLRTVKRFSSLEPRLEELGRLYKGRHLIGEVKAKSALLPDRTFRYFVLSFTLKMNKADFGRSLPDIVKDVFLQRKEGLGERMAESLMNEFYILFENLSANRQVILSECRAAAGGEEKLSLRVGRKNKKARIQSIEEDGSLRLVFKDGTPCS